MAIDHTRHGHLNTTDDNRECEEFMATHDGMDQVTYRVAQREAEMEDAFWDEDVLADDE